MPQKTSNLQAVATAAGVSRATASLALRGDLRIAAATRGRVRAAAERLGYTTNPLVGTLMSALRKRTGKAKVTMGDIAKSSGISRPMVSLVLRHPTRGTKMTVAKVHAAMKALGYRRDPLQSALKIYQRRHTHRDRHTTIAFLTTHPVSSPWRRFHSYVQMHEGAVRRARELGYRLEEFDCAARGMNPPRLRTILLARNIHAVVVAPLPGRAATLEFDLDGFASVGLGSGFREATFDCVSNDQFQSIVLAMRQCLSLGYQRIGLVASRALSERLGGRWLAGYLMVQRELPFIRRLLPLMPESAEEISPLLASWVRKYRPDVVIDADNELEGAVFLPLAPRIGIVSLHVMETEGKISGIYQASEEVGARAIDLVVARLQNYGPLPSSIPGLHLVPGCWIDGMTATGR